MPTWLFVILISVSAVTLFVVGMSLSLIIRGRYIDSEISTNKHMQQRGIKCTVQEAMEEKASCSEHNNCAPSSGCSGACEDCA